jgi:hypothetical protein
LVSLVLCALVFPFLLGVYPLVRFTEEQIDIQLYPDAVRVEGWYVYTNPFPFPVIQGFTLPLPVDEAHPMPSAIAVTQVWPQRKTLPVHVILGAHRFDVSFAPREVIHLEVHYRQRAPAQHARYLLTTTHPWRHPLRQGEYRLWPKGVAIRESTYPLHASAHGARRFHRTHFMPQHNWDFTWEIDPS